MELLILLAILLVLAFPILSLVALARSGKGARALEELERLREEMGRLQGRLAQQEAAQGVTRRALEVAEARLAALSPREQPDPTGPLPAAASVPLPPPVAAARYPEPLRPEPLVCAPDEADTEDIPLPEPPRPEVPREPVPDLPVPPPPAAPPQIAAPPVVLPARPELAIRQPHPEGLAPAARVLPARNLEDLLGGQLFLKAGVAILVLGVVFAMGLVFQRMGPPGKVLMGLLAGLGLLAGGRILEARPGLATFGRTLVAGAWGILFFVAYAAGFVPAAQVLPGPASGVAAMLAAGGAAVAYSLRYRHEWTTVSAFLLIQLSLGVSARELGTGGNLAATLVAGTALAFLAWQRRWARLLGLGALGTWGLVALWMGPRPPAADLGLLGGLGLLAALHHGVMLRRDWEEGAMAWVGLAHLATFLGLLGFSLRECQGTGLGYLVAGLLGAAHLGLAFAYGRTLRRPLFLLASTAGLGALALVTPLRLGMHHPHAAFLRLLGLQTLLAWGVYLPERWFRRLAALGLAVVGLGFLLAPGGLGRDLRQILLALTGGLLLLNAILVRTLWREACATEAPWLGRAFGALGTLLLVVFVYLACPGPVQGPVLAGMALVAVGVALRVGAADAALEGLVLGGLALLTLGVRPVHLGSELAVLLCLGAAHGASRLFPGDGERPWLRAGASALAVATLALVLLRHVPAPWALPAGALAALALVAGGLGLRWREWVAEGLLGFLAVTGALLLRLGSEGAPIFHLGARAWELGLTGLLLLGLARLLVWGEGRWPFAPEHRQLLESLAEGASLILLGLLAWLDLPALWQAPAFMALAALWLHGASHSAAPEGQRRRIWTGCLLALAGFLALAVRTWELSGTMGPLTARTASGLLALALAYVAHQRFDRGPDRPGSFHASLSPESLARLGTLFLLGNGCFLGLLVKAEALAQDRDGLVALAWGLVGTLSLVRSRHLETGSPAWRLQGHLALAAAILHFWLGNLLGTGDGPGLRLLAALAMLGMPGYLIATWSELDGRGRSVYLAACQATLALVLLKELPGAWVLPAWALQGLGSLLAGLRLRDVSDPTFGAWSRAGLVLALAAGVRGFASNLASDPLGLEVLALPMGVLGLLGGYVALNRLWHREPEAGGRHPGLGLGLHRMPWFVVQAGLLFAFLWVEASGTELTVWLSGFGLGMVGLGFALAERVARRTGLEILTLCILKLFLYDLRGLEGLARVASFLVLGLVLIAVSFAYTRFKDRVL